MRRRNTPSIKAEALRTQLEADPDYQKLRRRQEEDRTRRATEYRLAAEPVIAALDDVGFRVESLNDLLGDRVALESEVVRVLIEQLSRIDNDGVLDTVIRSLVGSREPFDGRCLVRLFEQPGREGIRWTIAHVIAHAPVKGISNWVLETARNSSYGIEREPLIRALPKFCAREKAISALLEILPESPGHAAYALGKVGRTSEIDALRAEGQKLHEHKWIDREISKAIQQIKRRES